MLELDVILLELVKFTVSDSFEKRKGDTGLGK